MKVIRYSKNGFKAQEQTYHMQEVNYHLYDFNINEYTEHLRPHIQKKHNILVPFYLTNYNDFKRGIWVFIDGYKNNQSLNHLKEKVPCFEAELPDDIMVYDVNWEKQMKLDDFECTLFGCYIPERSLVNIKNIKRRRKRNV